MLFTYYVNISRIPVGGEGSTADFPHDLPHLQPLTAPYLRVSLV